VSSRSLKLVIKMESLLRFGEIWVKLKNISGQGSMTPLASGDIEWLFVDKCSNARDYLLLVLAGTV
jgi:hypothetical protein